MISKTPTVSAIIPAYNRERYVREALHSVLAQTHPCSEIIVVDDGSTDQTAAQARQSGSRIQVVSQEHRGIGTARNHGIRLAQGDYLALLDSDDLWLPDKIEKQLACFLANPKLDIVITNYIEFYEDGRPDTGPYAGYSASTILLRRDFFLRVGWFSELTTTHDFIDWFSRAQDAGACCCLLKEDLVRRRVHTANISRNRGSASGAQRYLQSLKTALDRRRKTA